MTSRENTDDGSPLLFYKPPRRGVWDNVLHVHEGTFFLFNQDGLPGPGYSLSTSPDGVHWTYQGTAYEAPDFGLVTASGGSPIWTALVDGERKHFMQTASHDGDDNVVAFLESDDLYTWRLSRRVDLWLGQVVARRSGGYEAFGEGGQDENGNPRYGSAESDDGITWRRRDPVALTGLVPSPDHGVELGGVIERDGTYYFLAGLNDLEHCISDEDGVQRFIPGCTTLIADSAAGPARPAPKNHRLMVTNNAYFLRFSVLPDEVVVNHISFEANPDLPWALDADRSYIGPLKHADWDAEGTLRLTYWHGNETAKSTPIDVAAPERWAAGIGMLEPAFDTDETSLIEGRVRIPDSGSGDEVGVYLRGDDGSGAAFLIRADGVVEYGTFAESGRDRFSRIAVADRELGLRDSASFRLIRRRRMTEFYLDDFVMICVELPATGTGEVGLVGSREDFSEVRAWYCRG